MPRTEPDVTAAPSSGRPDPASPASPASPAPPDRAVRAGASAPQSGVAELDPADRLPRRPSSWPATVWWLGVHGGSGESTLASLTPGTRAAGHEWPISLPGEPPHRVVLVARTSYAGLAAAQRAARDWASGALRGDADVVGLLLLADAPGRLPRALRDLAALVSGGVPRSWMLPWFERWRLPEPGPAPAALSSIVAELTADRASGGASSPASLVTAPPLRGV